MSWARDREAKAADAAQKHGAWVLPSLRPEGPSSPPKEHTVLCACAGLSLVSRSLKEAGSGALVWNPICSPGPASAGQESSSFSFDPEWLCPPSSH